MKIRLSHLRRIIREVLDEESWVPGRWYPDGDPVDPDEIELMSTGGLGGEEPDDLKEGIVLTVDNMRRCDMSLLRRKYPDFIRMLTSQYGAGLLVGASCAISSQGFFGGGVPVVAFPRGDLPVVYWDGVRIRTNTSASLVDAVKHAS